MAHPFVSIFDELCICVARACSEVALAQSAHTASHTLFCSLTTPGGSLAPRTFKYETARQSAKTRGMEQMERKVTIVQTI